jgi:hypothetical protein
MTTFVDVAIGDLFIGKNGRAVFVKDYLDKHPGKHPVYSASLEQPFGHVDTYDYDGDEYGGSLLTWVMNGYGGRVQEISGKFSANRDRVCENDGTRRTASPDRDYAGSSARGTRASARRAGNDRESSRERRVTRCDSPTYSGNPGFEAARRVLR